ncbi:MAG: hypothetical protein WDW38_005642 [Sanguina aurantia]
MGGSQDQREGEALNVALTLFNVDNLSGDDRGGIERRWVNRRGHKWKNEVVLAQRLKTVSTLYSVPLPGANQRSLNYGATFRDSNTTTSQSRTLELVANETELWHGWTRTLGVHALSGTFTVGKIGNEPDSTPGIEHGRSTEVFGEASLSRKKGYTGKG